MYKNETSFEPERHKNIETIASSLIWRLTKPAGRMLSHCFEGKKPPRNNNLKLVLKVV